MPWFFHILGVILLSQNIVKQNQLKTKVYYFEFFWVKGSKVKAAFEVLAPNVAVLSHYCSICFWVSLLYTYNGRVPFARRVKWLEFTPSPTQGTKSRDFTADGPDPSMGQGHSLVPTTSVCYLSIVIRDTELCTHSFVWFCIMGFSAMRRCCAKIFAALSALLCTLTCAWLQLASCRASSSVIFVVMASVPIGVLPAQQLSPV